MDRDIETLTNKAPLELVRNALDKKTKWIVILSDAEPIAIMPSADLGYIKITQNQDDSGLPEYLQLLEIPAKTFAARTHRVTDKLATSARYHQTVRCGSTLCSPFRTAGKKTPHFWYFDT